MLAKEKDQGYLYRRRCTLPNNVDEFESRLVNESSGKDGTCASDRTFRMHDSSSGEKKEQGERKRERKEG